MSSDSPQVPLAERAAAPVLLAEPTAGDLSWRPVTAADAAALLDLENTILAADNAPYRWSFEELLEELSEPWLDLPQNSLIGHDDAGLARAWALARTMPGDATVLRVLAQGGVHPDRRRQGIGRQVLAWTVGRARQILAADGRDLPGVIRAYVADGAPEPVRHLLRGAGFTPQRFFAQLRRDLAEPLPQVELTGSLRLAAWSDGLAEAARLAHNDAFRDHWGSQPQSPQQWAGGRAVFAPEWSFVVVDDSPDVEALLASPDTDPETAAALRAGHPLVVGYHIAGRYLADFEVRGYTFGFTDILGVRRGYRGQQVAVALLVAAMRAFVADDMAYAALDVDTDNPTGAFGLYSRLGYTRVDGETSFAIDV